MKKMAETFSGGGHRQKINLDHPENIIYFQQAIQSIF